MNGRIGLDTTFLIDFFNGDPSAVEAMRLHSASMVVCETSIFEFLCGNLTAKEEEIFLSAISGFPSVSFSRLCAIRSSKLFRAAKKSGRSLAYADCTIAGSYLAEGISQIITRNKKHFKGMKGLKVLEY